MDEKTKAKLKELLKDKYDEFITLLGDTPLYLSEGKIPLDRFNEVNTKVKTLEGQVATLTAENATLKSTNETLTGTINTNTITAKVDKVLSEAGARDLKVVKAVLDIGDIKDDAGVEALKTKVADLKKTTPYLFNGNTAGGQEPAGGGGGNTPTITKEQFDKMTYKEKVALFNTNKALYDQLAKAD